MKRIFIDKAIGHIKVWRTNPQRRSLRSSTHQTLCEAARLSYLILYVYIIRQYYGTTVRGCADATAPRRAVFSHQVLTTIRCASSWYQPEPHYSSGVLLFRCCAATPRRGMSTTGSGTARTAINVWSSLDNTQKFHVLCYFGNWIVNWVAFHCEFSYFIILSINKEFAIEPDETTTNLI